MSRTCATTSEGTARPPPRAGAPRAGRGVRTSAPQRPGHRPDGPWTPTARPGSVLRSMSFAARIRSAHPANGAGAAWARQAMAVLHAPTQKTP